MGLMLLGIFGFLVLLIWLQCKADAYPNRRVYPRNSRFSAGAGGTYSGGGYSGGAGGGGAGSGGGG